MTYAIIGTGNIAWFLTRRLKAAGHECKGVYSRDAAHASELAEAIRGDVVSGLNELKDGTTDVCFIAVSDMAIASVAQQLSFTDTILVHTSGASRMDILAGSAKDYAVLWPVYSIIKSNLPTHRNIPCAWEASSEKAKKVLLTMAHAITDVLFEAKEDQRRWLHLSAVIGNNFVNHLLAICECICRENNLPFSVIYPIIEQTFAQTKQGNLDSKQTGPAIRGDKQTMEKQVELLSDHHDWQNIYQAISASIENMYRGEGKKQA